MVTKAVHAYEDTRLAGRRGVCTAVTGLGGRRDVCGHVARAEWGRKAVGMAVPRRTDQRTTAGLGVRA
jgi:hypothetical protein